MMQAMPPESLTAFAFPSGVRVAMKTVPEGPAAFAFPPGVRVAMKIGIPQHLMEFEEIEHWAANLRPTSMPPLPFGLIASQQATPSECEENCCPDSKGQSNEGTKPPADSDDDGKATGAYLSTAATSSDDERENESWPSESCNEEMALPRGSSEPLAPLSSSEGPPGLPVPRNIGGDIKSELPVTTLVIRHLPSLSTQAQLVQLWQPQHPEMDFLFVPYSAKQHRCCRYAFVNFSTAEAAQMFREHWAGQTLPGIALKKAQPLSIVTSLLQGVQANIDFHCKVGNHAKSRLPVIFADGKRVDLKYMLQNRTSTSR